MVSYQDIAASNQRLVLMFHLKNYNKNLLKNYYDSLTLEFRMKQVNSVSYILSVLMFQKNGLMRVVD